MTLKIATLFIICQFALSYIPHPDKEPHDFHSHIDSERAPYTDALGKLTGFEASPFKDGEYNHDREFEGYNIDFSGEDFYTLLVKPMDEVLLHEHIFDVEYMKTKMIVDYHSFDLHDRPHPIVFEIIDLAHNVHYRNLEDTHEIIKILYNSSGETFLRFINPNVRTNLTQNFPVKINISATCLQCGVFRQGFMRTGDMELKMKKLKEVRGYISELNEMTQRTKEHVFMFSEGKQYQISNFRYFYRRKQTLYYDIT